MAGVVLIVWLFFLGRQSAKKQNGTHDGEGQVQVPELAKKEAHQREIREISTDYDVPEFGYGRRTWSINR